MNFQKVMTMALIVLLSFSGFPNKITGSIASENEKSCNKISGSSQSRPVGIDLDVTLISRTPRYPWDSAKKWPDEGEVVTFTAHVRNKGTIASGPFAFLWKVDDQIVSAGTAQSILPGAETTQEYSWIWTAGRYHVSYQVDPQDLVPETAETNNLISDATDALTLGVWVEQSVYDQFNDNQNAAGTYSWEDWAQRIIQKMNWMFEQSMYPIAPQGILSRVRLDDVTIVPDGTLLTQGPWNDPSNTIYDGRWGFSYEDWQACTTVECYDVPWVVIHELGHFLLQRVDLYALDVQGGDVNVLDEGGLRIAGTPLLPYIAWDVVHYASRIYDVMHNASPYSLFSDYHAASLNRDWPQSQRTHPGDAYVYQIPTETRIKVLDNNDQPMANVEVSVYQVLPGDGSSGLYSQNFDNTPDIVGVTDPQGLFSLGGQPFGQIENYGITAGIDLVKLKDSSTGHYDYIWLEVTDLNLAYWAGQTGIYLHDVHFPEGPKRLRLSETSLHFSILQGSNPVPKSIQVEMLGEGFQYWTVEASHAAWLRTIPSPDTAIGNSATPPGPLTFIIDCDELPAGIYTTRLIINGGEGTLDSPQEISVSLAVVNPALYMPLISH